MLTRLIAEGLVVLYYRLCRGINIHHDGSYDNGGSFATCFNGEVTFWQDTQSPTVGDVVVAYRGNTPVHIAMIWGRDRILPCERENCGQV